MLCRDSWTARQVSVFVEGKIPLTSQLRPHQHFIFFSPSKPREAEAAPPVCAEVGVDFLSPRASVFALSSTHLTQIQRRAHPWSVTQAHAAGGSCVRFHSETHTHTHILSLLFYTSRVILPTDPAKERRSDSGTHKKKSEKDSWVRKKGAHLTRVARSKL